MLVLEMRLYFAMTEKNIAEKIFPYIPFQTMTWSDSDLLKVLLDLSKLHRKNKTGSKNTLSVVVSLDFNKLNQRWRYESTELIFRTMDSLLGTPGLIEFSHKFFEHAFFYLSSNLCPPDFLRSKTADQNRFKEQLTDLLFSSEVTWLGQEGGCEGLQKKGWTAIISAALVVTMLETGVPGTIIGQGDNQVIVASFSIPYKNMTPSEYIENHSYQLTTRIDQYLASLKRITSGIGMDLKLQESRVSSSLMSYNKEMIVNGSFVSGGLKKIGRAYQEVNDLAPTLQNKIASIYTSAQATALKSFNIFTPYFIATLESLTLITRERLRKSSRRGGISVILAEHSLKLDHHIKLCFLLLPRECGGLPVLPFLSKTFRII